MFIVFRNIYMQYVCIEFQLDLEDKNVYTLICCARFGFVYHRFAIGVFNFKTTLLARSFGQNCQFCNVVADSAYKFMPAFACRFIL